MLHSRTRGCDSHCIYILCPPPLIIDSSLSPEECVLALSWPPRTKERELEISQQLKLHKIASYKQELEEALCDWNGERGLEDL